MNGELNPNAPVFIPRVVYETVRIGGYNRPPNQPIYHNRPVYPVPHPVIYHPQPMYPIMVFAKQPVFIKPPLSYPNHNMVRPPRFMMNKPTMISIPNESQLPRAKTPIEECREKKLSPQSKLWKWVS